MKHVGLTVVVLGLVAALPVHAEKWSKTYNISGTPDLRVETSDANIQVDTWDQKTIEATVVSTHYRIGPGGLQIDEHQSGDIVEINVRFPHNLVNFNFSSHRVDINIHMPRQGRVNLRTGDGKIAVTDLHGDIELSSCDGAQEMHGVVGSLHASTGDGSITADGTFSALNLKTGDGHVNVRAAAGSKLDDEWNLHTGDGNVTLEIPENISADLYLRTGDGHIEVNLPITTEGRLKNNEVHAKLNGGGKLITVHTGDGSISIRKG